MAKSVSQKNQETLLKQSLTELDKLREELPKDLIRAAEDRVLKQSLDVLEGVISFAELGFDEKGQVDENQIPFAWHELSDAEKAKKIRLARFGMMSTADIPHGAKLAHAAAIGIIKSRAQEKSGTRILNLEVSTFPQPAALDQSKEAIDADFEVIDLE
jgi:hypothetical protein